MTIDPYLQAVIDAMRDNGFRLPEPLEAQALRAVLDNPMPGPIAAIAVRRDLEVPGAEGPIAARLYHPAPGEIVPLVLFFHGGGWVVGTLDTHDRLAAELAARSGCALLSIGYRLAPEHRFPEGLEDCLAVAAAVPGLAADLGVRAERYGVAGDSAGGNLAAALALVDAGTPNAPAHQLLLYPVLDADFATESYRTAPAEGFLTPAMMHWFWDQYASAEQRSDPRAAPLRARNLSQLAPATIILAGNDPLHAEGAAFAARLEAEGVPVRLHDYPGAIHGFASLVGMAPIADEAVAAAAAALRTALH